MGNCSEKSVSFSLRPLRLCEKLDSRKAGKIGKDFHVLRVGQRPMGDCLEMLIAPTGPPPMMKTPPLGAGFKPASAARGRRPRAAL